MRSNFELSSSNITRVHLQTVIAVSQLLGDLTSAGLNNSRFQESLSLINSYANSDKVMKNTGMYKLINLIKKFLSFYSLKNILHSLLKYCKFL